LEKIIQSRPGIAINSEFQKMGKLFVLLAMKEFQYAPSNFQVAGLKQVAAP
jgi:hypothetical protein